MARPPAKTERSSPSPSPDLPAWAVALGCLALAVVFCWPALASGAAFGINDWDLHLFYAESARRSLLRYGQVPWWNPWYCGGSPLLANPSSTFLNPLFVPSLLLGVLTGAKVQIALHQAVGMLGAWLLARRFGARGATALVAPVVFGLSSVYTLHLATGHSNWLALGFLPFAALFAAGAIDAAAAGEWRRALREAIGAGFSSALLLFAGNAYFFVYQCLFALLYGVCAALGARPWRQAWRPLAGGAGVGLATLALSALKLVPMAAFLSAVQRYDVADKSGASLSLLFRALTDRASSLTAFQLPGMQWRWWEYGAYVGLLPLLLALLGAVVARGRGWRLACVGLFFLLLAMGNEGPVWGLLRSLHGFEGLRVPARAIAYVVLVVSCFAAVGATWLAERARAQWAAAAGTARARGARLVDAAAGALVAALALSAALVSRPPLAEAFSLPPQQAADTPEAPFRQGRGRLVFQTRTRYSDLLDRAMRNEGTLNCYERLHLKTAARSSLGKGGQPDPMYRGEAWIDGGAGGSTARIALFSPNRVTVEVDAARGGTLVLNQNWDAPWRVAVGDRRPEPARSHEGVLAVALPSGGGPVRATFSYEPPAWGAAVTAASVLAAAALLVATPLWRRRRRA